MNYCLITITQHDFPIENQKSGFNSRDADLKSFLTCTICFYFYAPQWGKKNVFYKCTESRRAEKPLWLAFHYLHMLGVEFWEGGFVIVTKFVNTCM